LESNKRESERGGGEKVLFFYFLALSLSFLSAISFSFSLSLSQEILFLPFLQRVDAETGLEELDVELDFVLFLYFFGGKVSRSEKKREKRQRQGGKSAEKERKHVLTPLSPGAATPSPPRPRTGASW